MIRYWLLVVAGIILLIYLASLDFLGLNNPKEVILDAKRWDAAWVDKLLEQEFAYYREHGIGNDQIDKFKALVEQGKLPNIGYFEIKDHVLNYHCSKNSIKRCKIVASKLEQLANEKLLENNVIFVGLEDEWDYLTNPKWEIDFVPPPIMVFAADSTSEMRRHYILFVDDHTIGDSRMGYRRGWNKIYQETERGNARYSWEKKRPLAVWRGLNTDASRYKALSPRQRLVALGGIYPEKIDAKFTQTKYFNFIVRKILRPAMQQLGIPPFMTIPQQIGYQIVINADGMTATYPGFLWRLLSSSVVIKQESTKEQWFYNLTQPWKHYIPCAHDFSNLVERVDWVLQNQGLAKEIAENATTLAKDYLRPQYIDYYLVQLINYQARLVK